MVLSIKDLLVLRGEASAQLLLRSSLEGMFSKVLLEFLVVQLFFKSKLVRENLVLSCKLSVSQLGCHCLLGKLGLHFSGSLLFLQVQLSKSVLPFKSHLRLLGLELLLDLSSFEIHLSLLLPLLKLEAELFLM